MAQRLIRQENHRGLRLLIACALIAMSGRLAPCQTTSVPPSAAPPVIAAPSELKPAYEVATIKPPQENGFATPLRVYIQSAFGIPLNTIGWVIGPDWINSANYVIQAKPPDSIRDAMQTMSAEERIKETRLMMQSLLADRFQMKAHFETREMPVYELLVAKGGPKLKENPDSTNARYKAGGTSILGTAITIENLTDVLEARADVGGRNVVNKTGLTGRYDISLKWTPLQAAAASGSESGSTPASGDEGVSFFTAIEEQLGLKLVPTKAPGQVLIIDHIERPSEN